MTNAMYRRWSVRAVDVEEVRGQERGGVGAQEDAPGLVAVRWRRDAVSTQDLADSGGREPVPESAQLTLDAYYSPVMEMLSSTFPGLCGAGDYVNARDGTPGHVLVSRGSAGSRAAPGST